MIFFTEELFKNKDKFNTLLEDERKVITSMLDVQTIKKGTLMFSNNIYWSTSSTTVKNVYDENSVLYTYVENYKTFLEKLGLEVYEARVIHSEELENLGCILSISYVACTSIGAPSWVYSTSYWTGTFYFEPGIWTVRSDGKFSSWMVSNDYEFGLRPVIVVPKSVIEENDSGLISSVIEFTIDGIKFEAIERVS